MKIDLLSLDELDEHFGPAIQPSAVHDHEKSLSPDTLTLLGVESANILLKFMQLAESNNVFYDFISARICVLWAMRSDGQIFVAFEELFSESSTSNRFPLIRKFPVVQGFPKLGHPSLLAGSMGRLGGELLYDPNSQEKWSLTNKSARYGLNRGITRKQLDNVKAVFESYGIYLDDNYIGVE